MGNGQANTALRRKVEAGRTSVAAARQVTPARALSTAFVQGCDSRLGLAATVTSCSARIGTLAELLDTLPEGGLLAVLEGPGEAQGLMVLDPPLLSALIEKLMTGELADRPSRPRRPTRTDAALAADLIDDILRGFEAPFLGTATARWAAGFGYGSHLDDVRPLELMFEDVDYRVHTLAADLEAGRRSATLVLAVPAEGRGAPGAAPAPGASGDAGAPPAPEAAEGAAEMPWSAALEEQVMRGAVRLDAELARLRLPLSALEGLAPGQELPVPAAALDATRLIGADGATVARGRLGQSTGWRAVRLAGAADAALLGVAGTFGDRQDGQGGDGRGDDGRGDDGHGGNGQGAQGAGTQGAAPPSSGAASLPAPPSAGAGDAPTGREGAQADPLDGLPDLPPMPDGDWGEGPDAADPSGDGAAPDLPDLPDLPKL